MDNWYVINTKPKQEKKAMVNLLNQRFKVILPQIKSSVNSRGKEIITNQPLFPSYLFVKFCLKNDLWSKINNTFGVKKIVSFGSIPSFVNKNFMRNLISCIDKDGFINSDFFELKKQQNVKIKNGPFAGCLAEIIKVDAKKRVNIFLDLFKRKIITSVEKKNLLP